MAFEVLTNRHLLMHIISFQDGLPIREWTAEKAALCGAIHVMQHIENPTGKLIDIAAARGHLDMVKYLHDHNIGTCTVNAIDIAALNGHTDVVKFLYENRTEGCTTIAIDLAARGGIWMS